MEYPDIAPRMKEIGAAPNKRSDGSVIYTLPVLRDPNTSAVITDSFDIAVYLDNTYPEKPVLPEDAKGLISVIETALYYQFMLAYPFLVMRGVEILKKPSADFYTTTREKAFNKKLAEFSPVGPERDQHWVITERTLATVKTWYDKTEGKWLMGKTFSHADIIVATGIFCLKKVLHEDEWERMAAWHDGQWARLLADVESECNMV